MNVIYERTGSHAGGRADRRVDRRTEVSVGWLRLKKSAYLGYHMTKIENPLNIGENGYLEENGYLSAPNLSQTNSCQKIGG